MTSTQSVPPNTGKASSGKPACQLLIHRCSDPQLWYADLVGQQVPLVTEDESGYWSREPTGYLNIVRREDAAVVTTEGTNGRRKSNV